MKPHVKAKMLRREAALGMPFSLAQAELRRNVIYWMLKTNNLHYCFQCGLEILDSKLLTIEHKKPWFSQPNSAEMFFDLNNIAFSHRSCNVRAGAKQACKKIREVKSDGTEVIHNSAKDVMHLLGVKCRGYIYAACKGAAYRGHELKGSQWYYISS